MALDRARAARVFVRMVVSVCVQTRERIRLCVA